jgi:hypothetical protein
MAILSYTEQLESVQTAIARIEAGAQTTEYNGRRVTKGDLETMYAREKWLRGQVTEETRSSAGQARNTVRYVVPR